jgi:hypothetical protein
MLKTDAASNLETLRNLKVAAMVFFIVTLPFIFYLTSCSPKSDLEKIVATPPMIYEQSTNEAVPATQQILIPFSQLAKDDKFSFNQYHPSTEEEIEHFQSDKTWSSASIPFHSHTGRLYVYMDFAGQQSTRKDIDFYLLPICDTSPLVSPCKLSAAQEYENYFTASTHKNTDYQTLEQNKLWLYYGHDFSKQYYLSPPQQYLKFMLRANIPEGYDSRWIRISFSDSPIVLKQVSYFMQNQHVHIYQYLLLLIPILAGALLAYYKQFYDMTHAIIGLSLFALFSIHVMIWDIHYMVISCLLLALAGMLYSFGIWLYFWVYLAGVYIVSTYAYQYYAGFNKGFFMQIGLILLIGFALYMTEQNTSREHSI